MIFYECVVASAIRFIVVCWGTRLKVADTSTLNKLIRKASDVVGVELDSDGGLREENAGRIKGHFRQSHPTFSMTSWSFTGAYSEEE